MLAHFCEGCSKYSSIKTKLFRICGWRLKSWNHFPSKEALILGVVDYLMEDLQNNRAVCKNAEPTALDELRLEFEDIRWRLHRTPEQFIVLSDLAVRPGSR